MLRGDIVVRCCGGRALLLVLLGSCNYPSTDDCPFYCWESSLEVVDIPEDPMKERYYPQTCTLPVSPFPAIFVPLPSLGYAARACYTGQASANTAENTEHHFLTKMAIQKLQAAMSLDSEEEDAYEYWPDALDDKAWQACVAHLTCNGNNGPGSGCDIDGDVTGDQRCTISSAEALCTAQITGILEGQLELPTPEKYPECSGVEYFTLVSSACEGFIPDLNGTGGYCGDDGFVPGMDSTSMGSADTTGTSGERFGDLDELITCSSNDCDLDAELVINVIEHFSAFYDDGVTLEYVDDVACGEGAKIDGLSAGTAPTALTDEFNIDNGDIIAQVNGIDLSSGNPRAASVLEELDTETDFTVVVKRPHGMSCTTTIWTLEIVR